MKPSLTESAAACTALVVKLRIAAVTRPQAERRASVLFIPVSIGFYGRPAQPLCIFNILGPRLMRAIRQGRKYPLGMNEVKAYDTALARRSKRLALAHHATRRRHCRGRQFHGASRRLPATWPPPVTLPCVCYNGPSGMTNDHARACGAGRIS